MPYYLSDLGNFVKSRNFEIPAGVRFKDYLVSRFHGRLVVVQDRDTPAKIAIATPENETTVRKQLSDSTASLSENLTTNHSRLPFSLVAAFCIVPPPNMKVFYRTTKPYRYEIHSQAPDDRYVVIDEEFRPNALAGKSSYDLSPGEKQEIYSYIDRWANENEIDLHHLYFDRGTEVSTVTSWNRTNTRNALRRLIDAQEPGMKWRIKIPGDIASKLMDLP